MITNVLPPFYGSQCIYGNAYQLVLIGGDGNEDCLGEDERLVMLFDVAEK